MMMMMGECIKNMVILTAYLERYHKTGNYNEMKMPYKVQGNIVHSNVECGGLNLVL